MCKKGKLKAKEEVKPYSDGTYFIGDMICSICGKEAWRLLGMTEKQLKMDREYTDKVKNS